MMSVRKLWDARGDRENEFEKREKHRNCAWRGGGGGVPLRLYTSETKHLDLMTQTKSK